MNQEHDASEPTTTDEGAELGPLEAAALLEGTKKRAQRQFAIGLPIVR